MDVKWAVFLKPFKILQVCAVQEISFLTQAYNEWYWNCQVYTEFWNDRSDNRKRLTNLLTRWWFANQTHCRFQICWMTALAVSTEPKAKHESEMVIPGKIFDKNFFAFFKEDRAKFQHNSCDQMEQTWNVISYSKNMEKWEFNVEQKWGYYNQLILFILHKKTESYKCNVTCTATQTSKSTNSSGPPVYFLFCTFTFGGLYTNLWCVQWRHATFRSAFGRHWLVVNDVEPWRWCNRSCSSYAATCASYRPGRQ